MKDKLQKELRGLRKKRSKSRRATAWLVIFAMFCALLSFSAEQVSAATVEVVLQEGQGATTAEVKEGTSVDVNLGVPEEYNTVSKVKDAGLTKMEIKLKITGYTGADNGQTPGVQPYFGYAETWGSKSDVSWVNLSNGELTVTMDFSSFLTNGSDNIWAYGIQFANVTGTVSYEIVSAKLTGTKSTTGGNESGGGGSSGEGGTTYTSHANFAKLLQYSLYFYDANMCGGEVESKSLVASGKKYGSYTGYRKNCHTCDEKAAYNGKEVDVSGGYHDAGDHAKFNLPQAYSATTLGLAYAEFPEAFQETGQMEHYKTIMNHFCDYFVKCTILNEAGTGVEAYCYQVGDGGTDHSYWGQPESQPARSDQAYFTSSSTPCTDIVGETAAALAIHACNFPEDENAEKYLNCAKLLFAYGAGGTQASSSGSKASGFYNGSSWQDDMALAAVWLYRATGDAAYQAKYNEYTGGLNAGYLNCWDNMSVAALAYGKDWSNAKASVDSYKTKTVCDGYVFVDPWGSARYNTSLQFEALCYDKNTDSTTYTDWAKEQMNYILGENSTGHCYVVGYNDSSSKNPHHRAASGFSSYDEFNQGAACKNVLLGALCGGISNSSSHSSSEFSPVEFQSDSSYFYHDSVKCYVCNEVALDYNATLVAAAAGLYARSKTDGNQMLDTNYKIDDSATCDANEGGDETKGADPSESGNPAETAKPGESSNPTETAKPGESGNPAETEKPGESGNPTETAKPGESGNPAETAKPGESSNPTETAKPGESSNPAETAKPGESGNPAETAKPGESSNPAETAKPGESGNPAETAKPSETASPTVSPGSSASVQPDGKANNPKLSKKKLKIKRGKKGKVVLSNVAKAVKVKLKYQKKKAGIKLKKNAANQKQYVISAKKKGNCTVTFVIGKKKLKLKIIVK